MRQSLAEQIRQTRASLAAAKPRSYLRIKLELRLRDLMVRKLKQELKSAA